MGASKHIVPLMLIVVTLAACGAGTEGSRSSHGDAMGGMPSTGGSEGYTFGMPGALTDVDRTVHVNLLDEPRFQPSNIDVRMGQTVAFRITNVGQTAHEFVLGDGNYQLAHEASMGEMEGAMSTDAPNAIALRPGETKTLVWTFTDAGSVLYGCHVSGHYAAGMVGAITVAA